MNKKSLLKKQHYYTHNTRILNPYGLNQLNIIEKLARIT